MSNSRLKHPSQPILRVAAALVVAGCAGDPTDPATAVPAGDSPATAAVQPSVATSSTPGSWAPRASAPTIKVAAAAAVVPNASGQYILYTFGGFSQSSRVDAYNAATNAWTKRLTMTAADWPDFMTDLAPNGGIEGPAIHRAAALNFNKKLYLVGGEHADGQGADVESAATFAYDPVANRWTRMATMGEWREDHVVGKVKNGAGVLQIVAVGGVTAFAGKNLNSVEAFTP